MLVSTSIKGAEVLKVAGIEVRLVASPRQLQSGCDLTSQRNFESGTMNHSDTSPSLQTF